jgi:hypothetical protein
MTRHRYSYCSCFMWISSLDIGMSKKTRLLLPLACQFSDFCSWRYFLPELFRSGQIYSERWILTTSFD